MPNVVRGVDASPARLILRLSTPQSAISIPCSPGRTIKWESETKRLKDLLPETPQAERGELVLALEFLNQSAGTVSVKMGPLEKVRVVFQNPAGKTAQYDPFAWRVYVSMAMPLNEMLLKPGEKIRRSLVVPMEIPAPHGAPWWEYPSDVKEGFPFWEHPIGKTRDFWNPGRYEVWVEYGHRQGGQYQQGLLKSNPIYIEIKPIG